MEAVEQLLCPLWVHRVLLRLPRQASGRSSMVLRRTSLSA